MIVKEEFMGKLRRHFNLNLYEVRIWTALLSRGVSTAGELSSISDVPRSRTYDILESLEKKGFNIIKKRIKENSVYSVLKFNTTLVRFEAIFKDIKNFILKEYETSESVFINVYTLTPEELIKEKVEAYTKRKKIRDLYDIFFLLSQINAIRILFREIDFFQLLLLLHS